ncbi:MAG: hypothetical protein WBO49_01080 [Candidatus Saccharimonas sp.]
MTEFTNFFAIEGGDGSGKGTQTRLLTEALRAEGREVYSLSFPRYGKLSAKVVGMYLDGAFGDANDVAPELASAPYALDRVAGKYDLEDWLETHPEGIALTNRYTLSNAAHQGTKIPDYSEREAFYRYILELEFGELRLPRPRKNVILLVPPDIAQQNVDKKAARSYTNAKRDIHESDSNHLALANRNYREIAELFPEFTVAIEAYSHNTNKMRAEAEIHAEIRQIFEI